MYKLLAGCLLASCLCLPATAGEPGRDSIFGEGSILYETGTYDKALELWDLMRLQDALDEYEKGLDEWEKWLEEFDDYLYGPIS